MAVLMLCSMFGILSVSGCFASVVESTDMWMAMNKRLESIEKKLAQVENLEKKLEQYSLKNEELVLENQALRQRVHDIEATNSEMTTEIKTLTTITNDCQKNYQIILNDVEKIKKENFMKFASNTTSDLAISKNDIHAQGHEIKYRESGDRTHKRIVPRAHDPAYQIAFYTYLSANSPADLRQHHTLVFDTVKTNMGDGYHVGDGIFTVPSSGLYVFAWTVTVQIYGWASVEIVVNAEVLGSAFADSSSCVCWDDSAGFIVVHVNAGDHVFIRMQENGHGPINSNARGRTSFSGWKL